ncbi:hypothetical protein SOVF_092770 [Spinacia oleracea]|nr:hypothetical protein SOVF_092770 [Spinacia oleracea]
MTKEQQRIQDELNLLGRLSHPNCARLLGYCWTEEKFYLVSEYMPKGSLDNHILNGKQLIVCFGVGR